MKLLQLLHFLFLPDDPDASNGSKSTRAERARKKKAEANANADKNKDNSAADGAGGKNNKNDKNGEDKKDMVTEADIKIEPDKSGRRTPLHARDMDPVSCTIQKKNPHLNFPPNRKPPFSKNHKLF